MGDVMAAQPNTLSDDEITALIGDPSKIETREVAMEIMGVLDAEIADIQTQLDAAMIEANLRPLSAERQAWARRASYAAAMRRREYHRVLQRDRELRNAKLRGPQRRDPEEGRLKQQRLQAEADARREQAVVKREALRLGAMTPADRDRLIAVQKAIIDSLERLKRIDDDGSLFTCPLTALGPGGAK